MAKQQTCSSNLLLTCDSHSQARSCQISNSLHKLLNFCRSVIIVHRSPDYTVRQLPGLKI